MGQLHIVQYSFLSLSRCPWLKVVSLVGNVDEMRLSTLSSPAVFVFVFDEARLSVTYMGWFLISQSVMILMWTVMMQNEVFQEFDILNGLSTLREIMENSLTKTEVAFIGNVLVFVPYSLPWNHQPFSKNHKLLLLQFYFEVPAPRRISPYFPWIEFS